MKKRILALLLAGLLTASLASCFNNSSNVGNKETTGGTEPEQTTPSVEETTAPDEPIVFKEVDETVYTVVDKAKLLISPDSTTGIVQVNKLTEMRRIKVNAVWSVVEYMDQEYYVASVSLTNADLLGKNFTACSPEKTMYVKSETLNIRMYASSEQYSTVIDHLERNDTVTVVAEGTEWSKIKYVNEDETVSYYFVFSEYLTDTQYVDPDTVDYSSYFTPCDPFKTMYVTADSVNLRKNAHAESTWLGTLEKGTTVTVIAIGAIEDSTWAKIRVTEPGEEGDPDNIYDAYVNAKYLSENGGTTVTLEDILAEYPDYEKLETPLIMYANSVCWVRTSPIVISDKLENGEPNPDFNGIGNLNQKDQITIVATGAEWVIIQLEEQFCFVHVSVLTTDPNGNPVALSLEQLLKLHPEFSAITGIQVTANGKVNCYTEPKVGEDVAKELVEGTEVTKVAVSDLGNWCIIKTADGAYYFAGNNLFTEVPQNSPEWTAPY